MSEEVKEKRRFPRIKHLFPLHCQIRGNAKSFNTLCDNISLGGIGFIADEYIAPNTLIMLEMNVLSRMLNSIGRITWAAPFSHSDKYSLGVEFMEFDTGQKKYLGDYIDMQTGKL